MRQTNNQSGKTKHKAEDVASATGKTKEPVKSFISSYLESRKKLLKQRKDS